MKLSRRRRKLLLTPSHSSQSVYMYLTFFYHFLELLFIGEMTGRCDPHHSHCHHNKRQFPYYAYTTVKTEGTLGNTEEPLFTSLCAACATISLMRMHLADFGFIHSPGKALNRGYCENVTNRRLSDFRYTTDN